MSDTLGDLIRKRLADVFAASDAGYMDHREAILCNGLITLADQLDQVNQKLDKLIADHYPEEPV